MCHQTMFSIFYLFFFCSTNRGNKSKYVPNVFEFPVIKLEAQSDSLTLWETFFFSKQQAAAVTSHSVASL